jgi:hypothetical protein
MAEGNDTSKLPVALGIGAIIVTLLMTSGQWNIFDFGIATSILCFGFYYLRTNQIVPSNIWEVILFALPFAVITTASLIALLATLAFFIPAFAGIDVDTYRVVNHQIQISNEQNFQLLRAQAIWQWLIFLILFGVWAAIFYLLLFLRKKRQQEQEQVIQTEA